MCAFWILLVIALMVFLDLDKFNLFYVCFIFPFPLPGYNKVMSQDFTTFFVQFMFGSLVAYSEHARFSLHDARSLCNLTQSVNSQIGLSKILWFKFLLKSLNLSNVDD